MITSAFSGGSFPRSRLTMAQAFLRMPNARTTSSGMRSLGPPIEKWCSERCVCAPQYRSAGTTIGPMLSDSVRSPGSRSAICTSPEPSDHVLCDRQLTRTRRQRRLQRQLTRSERKKNPPPGHRGRVNSSLPRGYRGADFHVPPTPGAVSALHTTKHLGLAQQVAWQTWPAGQSELFRQSWFEQSVGTVQQ